MKGAPGQWWLSPWSATALWLLLLMALTLGLDHASWRYRVVVDPLLDNLDFSKAGRGWSSNGKGIQLYPGTPPVLVLNARGIGHNVMISRLLPRSARNPDWVRIGADLSSRNLKAGTEPWQRGRLILLSLDARGQRIWYWPQQVAAIDGSRSWQHYQADIPLDPRAAQTWLVAYVSAASGKLLIKNLEFKGVIETRLYHGARALIIGAWVLSGLWILCALAVKFRGSPAGLFTLLYAAILIAGGLTPQPQLRNSLNYGHQIMVHLLEGTASLLPQPSGKSRTRSPSPDQPPPGKGKQNSSARIPGTSQPGTTTSSKLRTRYASLIPHLRIGEFDQRAHLAAFVGLSLILMLAMRTVPRHRLALAALLLGAAIESLQTLLITREPEWVDLGYDAAGITVGAILALVILALGSVTE